jgi:hypothetical protein
VEIVSSSDVEPKPVMPVGVDGRSLLQHLQYEIVEAEWHARRDVVHDLRIHAVHPHAHEIGKRWLFAEADHGSIGLIVDDTELHLGVAYRRGNRQRPTVKSMAFQEPVQAEVGEDIAIEHQEGFVQLVAQKR